MRSRIPAARIGSCPRSRRTRGVGARALLALTFWLLAVLSFGVPAALAAPLTPLTLSASLTAARPPTTASCARLAQADPTATNGSLWGATILPGFDAPGGWFGVPVCANGVNQLAPGGANVSCDAAPAHAASGDCAPGRATSDGYGWSFQCVELVARFAAWAYGDAPGGWRGDAPYLWLGGHHPGDFSAERDGVSQQPPAPGDILVWGSLDSAGRPWPAGPAGGHVAVVAAVGGGHITFVEENMLGHRGAEAVNIPSETTTLTQSATGAWALGSTYGLNGGRALYGWLHSSRGSGHFPTGKSGKSGQTGATTATPGGAPATAAPTAPTASAASTLPSLAQGVIVTNSGALAELVWSDTHTPERLAGSQATPQAVVKPLGAPPGVALAPDQTPAVVTLPSGERYIFARGQDGALYSAYTPANTSSRQASVAWQALGAPPGAALVSGVSAQWTSQHGMLVGALGSDGAIWLCGGPAGMLGVWVSLGRPAQTSGFQSAPVLALTPSAAGLRALAIGADGRLYEADWSAPSAASPPSTGATATTSAATATATLAPAPDAPPGWSAWSAAPLPGVASALAPHLIVASAPQGAAQTSSAAGELDLLATGAAGQAWLLRDASGGAAGGQRPWSATPLRLPMPTSVALAAVVQPPADASAATILQVYAADAMSAGASSGASGAPSTATPGATSTPAPAATQARVSVGAFALPPAESGAQSASGAPAPAIGAWTALGTIALTPASTSTAAGSASSTPTAPAVQATTPTYTPTPNSAAPAASATGVSVALALGLPDQRGKPLSALLAASGSGALLLGAPAALRSLTPGLTPNSTSVALGVAPDPAAFSDDFSGAALDPRWLLAATPVANVAGAPLAQVAQGALTLSIPASSASAPSVAVAQGAPAGDFSLTVRVAPSDAANASHSAGLHSGIALRLDAWHVVTLALSQPAPGAAATVALCANAAGTPWCSASLPAPAAATQGVYLRVSQVGDAVTGFVSPDGTQWTTVGAWTLMWLPTSIAELGPYGPPLSPTATALPGGVALPGAAVWQRYTSVELFVSADAARSGAGNSPSARFSGFSITIPADAMPDPTPDATPSATSAAG